MAKKKISYASINPTLVKKNLEKLDVDYQDDPEAKNGRMLDELFRVLEVFGYSKAIEVYKNAKKY
jgi:hypothetical protein